ncbi:MAG TPA: purine-nucleoside phosphorylase [Candidatus Anaerofilum excrementigallinarum]|nr:purine-nucleoside phosphorylase [Candidatus Anaerofilum excrementigallinarum]
MKTMDKLESCLAAVRRKTDFEPQVALVLGSGLGDYGKEVEVETVIPYSEIEGFPVSTAPGHAGRFLLGRVAGVKVAVMQGRVHYYEGYPMEDVVLPARLLGLMGAKALFLTNAAGGVNYTMNPGDLMLLRDQITCFVPSPLIGPNEDKLGVRFPDMSRVYDEELAGIIRTAAAGCGIPLKEGVYCQLTGPQFESPAEIRMLRMLGADAVGMSTAVEAVAARHMGMRVAGVSCISNLACGMTSAPLTSEEVNETAARVADRFTRLVTESIRAMGAVL